MNTDLASNFDSKRDESLRILAVAKTMVESDSDSYAKNLNAYRDIEATYTSLVSKLQPYTAAPLRQKGSDWHRLPEVGVLMVLLWATNPEGYFKFVRTVVKTDEQATLAKLQGWYYLDYILNVLSDDHDYSVTVEGGYPGLLCQAKASLTNPAELYKTLFSQHLTLAPTRDTI